jgi:hypothetical protein
MVVVLGLPVILQMEPPEAHTAEGVAVQAHLLAMVERTTEVWVVLVQYVLFGLVLLELLEPSLQQIPGIYK